MNIDKINKQKTGYMYQKKSWEKYTSPKYVTDIIMIRKTILNFRISESKPRKQRIKWFLNFKYYSYCQL